MMSEDEKLREALEAELEDSYQEYLTYALKGETQDLMETSPEFKKNMKKLCEDAEKSAAAGAAPADTGVSSEHKESSQIIMLKPRSKTQRLAIRLTKVAVGLAAVAAVVIAVILFNLKDVKLNSRNPDWAQEGDKNAVAAANTDPVELALTDETKQEYPNSPSPVTANEQHMTDAAPEQTFSPNSNGLIYKSGGKLIVGVASDNVKEAFNFYSNNRGISIIAGKGVDEPGALPENVDGIREENNSSISEAEYDQVRLKLEVPYLNTPEGGVVTYSEICRVSSDGREMKFEVISREETEEATTVIVECSDPTGEKVKLLPGKQVRLDVVYDSENSDRVTWIYVLLDLE
ncbi:MAG: hypothetical protein IK125_06635 [Lachnospiraceae bacterium]|nr:hypothetical protein [Lachnospiraceae bacterium]